VLGISIDEPEQELKRRVAGLAEEAAGRLGETIHFSLDDILVNDGYLGQGYGIMGAPEREAIRLFAETEGLLLDPVYTGRAAAGLVDLIRRGFFKPEESVLFWHTGGASALFADCYAGDLLSAD
jgi:1-aminocyclopropane-1-carboxylate deaminase/D-cysteine desulfhydrase-like pyridoxal-dependent ACC family enzyme